MASTVSLFSQRSYQPPRYLSCRFSTWITVSSLPGRPSWWENMGEKTARIWGSIVDILYSSRLRTDRCSDIYIITTYIQILFDCNRWATSEFVLPAFDQCVSFLSIFVMECCFVVDCWTMGMSFYHLFDKMILWIWAVFKTPGWWLLPGIIIWLSNTNSGWTNHQWTGNPILNQSGNCQTCQLVQCLVDRWVGGSFGWRTCLRCLYCTARLFWKSKGCKVKWVFDV